MSRITEEEFNSFLEAGEGAYKALDSYVQEHGSPEEDARLRAMFRGDVDMLAMFFIWRQSRESVGVPQ
jgi:hypothetical protein